MGLRTLALCAGIGGLELGLRRVLPTRVVCWVERDPYSQRVLVARMQGGRLDDAPIWDDLTTFDAAAWRGQCDLVAAGFPCQPYSTAGKKLGPDDPRDLWPHVARVVSESGASVVCLENVARLVRATGGLDRVLRDLAALGFDAEWGVVRASDAGAPHRRARLFVLATSREGRDRLADALRLGEREERPGRVRVQHDGPGVEPVADRDGAGLGGERGSGLHDRGDPLGHDADGRGGAEVGDADAGHERGVHAGPREAQEAQQKRTPQGASGLRVGAPGRDAQVGDAMQPGREGRHDVRLGPPPRPWPPGPGDAGGWTEVLTSRPDLEPSVCRVAHGSGDGLDRDARGLVPDRRPRLRCLGNAVVPAQAALAFGELVKRVTGQP